MESSDQLNLLKALDCSIVVLQLLPPHASGLVNMAGIVGGAGTSIREHGCSVLSLDLGR